MPDSDASCYETHPWTHLIPQQSGISLYLASVFRLPTYFWLNVYALELRTIFNSRATKDQIMEAFLNTLVGRNPLECMTSYRVDECDCDLHLSNSNYAKALDCGIVKTVMRPCPQFVRTGGWLALAGTHFHFIREIPILILARYEVRVTIASWDQKWVFALCRFVTKESSNDMKTFIETGKLGNIPLVEPDGATVHATAIAQLCFKIGRITVPPTLVFASNRYSMPPSPSHSASRVGDYSHSNPPHWKIIKSLVSRLEGDITNLRKLYVGGWRAFPE
ncbi:hypothetical protein L218DRAFT_1001448 [Marasmius fiardii PR-910]|nr:hypothetical protein L218DRAFT_1001448 [Marasmius fiardii PR-910]